MRGSEALDVQYGSILRTATGFDKRARRNSCKAPSEVLVLDPLDDRGDPLPDADAHRRQPVAPARAA